MGMRLNMSDALIGSRSTSTVNLTQPPRVGPRLVCYALYTAIRSATPVESPSTWATPHFVNMNQTR
jgi:hypothetical protein